MAEKELFYQAGSGQHHKAKVLVKDEIEKIQSIWAKGHFYETQRHGLLNMVFQKYQGGTFVDVGAAIGNHSLFFAICCKAEKVLAFEPVSDAYKHLRQNLSLNNLRTVRAYNIALGRDSGEVGMIASNTPPEQGGAMMNRVDENGSGVVMKTLDEVLTSKKPENITYMKIDVKGYNLPVLQGAMKTIQKSWPAISCECDTAEEFQEVDDFLTGLGYQVITAQGTPFKMNNTPTYLWEKKQQTDITLIITTYNRPKSFQKLLKGLIADAGNYRVKCLIYNDHSDVKYKNIPVGNENFEINYYYLPENHGKRGHWRMMRRIFHDIRLHNSWYFIQLPDDVEIRPGFFKHAISTYEAIENPDKMCLNLYLDYQRIGRPNWTGILPKIETHNGINIFKTGWMDLIYLAERKLFEKLKFDIIPIPTTRWKSNPLLSSGVGAQISKILKGEGFYQVRDSFLESSDVPSVMNPHRPLSENLMTWKLDPIVCGIASIPDRANYLQAAINSVLPCIDELNVYLNNYQKIPKFLSHPKISVFRSQDHGDLGDAGKFFTVGQKKAYYFSIDDDIIYPSDFVWYLLNQLRSYQEHGKKVAVGLHGQIMRNTVKQYYGGIARRFHCANALQEAKAVHVLGTGALAFHTDDLSITINDFKGAPNMADIYFSIACQKQNVGCIVLPHPQNYVKIQDLPIEKTIFGTYRNRDQLQTNLFNSWRDWQIRT